MADEKPFDNGRKGVKNAPKWLRAMRAVQAQEESEDKGFDEQNARVLLTENRLGFYKELRAAEMGWQAVMAERRNAGAGKASDDKGAGNAREIIEKLLDKFDEQEKAR